MLLLSSLTTYSRWPEVVRLTGSSPPELTGEWSTSCSPESVTRNALIVPLARFGPALTTNRNRPSLVSCIDPDESTIGSRTGAPKRFPRRRSRTTLPSSGSRRRCACTSRPRCRSGHLSRCRQRPQPGLSDDRLRDGSWRDDACGDGSLASPARWPAAQRSARPRRLAAPTAQSASHAWIAPVPSCTTPS